jgi:hypothetical protein
VTTKGAKATKAPKRLAVDAEARALMANPVFRAMLDEAKPARPEDLAPWEELDERLAITAEDKAIAAEHQAVFDRLETEQGAAVTDAQDHLLSTVLIAARYLRGEKTLADWVEYTGIPAEELRAAAAALQAVGVEQRLVEEKRAAAKPPARRRTA